jgi:acyl transferase domain-containing protein
VPVPSEIAATATPLAIPAGDGTGPERIAGLMSYLQQELATLTELGGPEQLDVDAGLFDLGLTSAMVVSLRARLESAVGHEIPTTAVFEHPTIRRLAAYLAGPAGNRPDPADGQPARARPARRSAHAAEPLAIVGMGCRFPGGANDLAGYWRLLRDGRDGTREVPPERWDPDSFYDADPAAAGKMYTRRGGFLDVPVDGFDAEAFGISPREARSMDPQQRLLLEVAWEALEDAGYPVEALDLSTGVFVGINTTDYMQLLSAAGSTDIDAYVATGNTFSVAAGRLSYVLGVQGPSLAVDTACSSSLVAAHLAARSLRTGESDLAIVAGVNLMLSPATTVGMSKLRALSADGRCKTFDESADGYGRGEGCGVLVLKRLSDAVAAGDRVWAVMLGSATNQDGRSAGLTVPNGQAQQAVVRDALRDADVAPGSVGYVEAHGTGTPLGDPMELSSLVEVLGKDRDPDDPLIVGSAKTNVGHLEAAAGVCGIIKVALSLHHRQIPAHLNLTTPSPQIKWDELPVVVPTRTIDWAPSSGTRVAGVSSFGFSGTNAHVVLAEATPAAPPADLPPDGQRAELLVLSAYTPQALSATAGTYRAFLERDESRSAATWPEITRAAAVQRSHLPIRMSVVARSATEAAERLGAAARGARSGVRTGPTGPLPRLRLIFVFGGHGAQWPAMGRGLLADPTAAQVLDRCDAVVRELAGWSLRDELTADRAASRLHDTVFGQPAIFAMQAALVELWRSWGVTPDALVGHSVGEMAAAYAAGVFDLETATEIVLRRGQVMARAAGSGAMAVAGMPAEEVEHLIGRYGLPLSVAAVNSPVNTVVAGDRQAVSGFERVVRDRGAFWSALPGDYAFHSPQLLPLRDDLVGALGLLSPRPATTPIFSTVTGTAAPPGAFDAQYWAENVIGPVHFRDALLAAADDLHQVAVEVGPHSVLTTSISQSLEGHGSGPTVLSSMRAGRDSRETMLDAAGGLHVLGYRVDHRTLQPPAGRHVDLPTYPWQRQRHWLPDRPSQPGPAQVRSNGAPAAAAPAAAPGNGAGTARIDVRRRLQLAGTAQARVRLVEDLLQTEVAAVLGRPPETRLDREVGFFDAGMDSITSMELKNRLETILGEEVPATAAFEHPTIAALTGYILDDILRSADPPPDDPGPDRHPERGVSGAATRYDDLAPMPDGLTDERVDRLVGELEQLSEDELIKLLNEELEREGDREHG